MRPAPAAAARRPPATPRRPLATPNLRAAAPRPRPAAPRRPLATPNPRAATPRPRPATSTSGLSSSETTAAAAAIPAVYVETVDPRFPSGHGSRVAFLGTGEKWRQEWTRCDSHHERPDGWSARAV